MLSLRHFRKNPISKFQEKLCCARSKMKVNEVVCKKFL